MASLADLAYVFDQAQPSGFTLAQLGLQSDYAQEDYRNQHTRLRRDYGERMLPGLASSQGARGAWNTSATSRKANEMTQDVGDRLTDLATGAGRHQAQLASNALLAQTGIQL